MTSFIRSISTALPVSRDVSTAQLIDKQAPRHFVGLLRAAQFVAFRQGLPAGDIELTEVVRVVHGRSDHGHARQRSQDGTSASFAIWSARRDLIYGRRTFATNSGRFD